MIVKINFLETTLIMLVSSALSVKVIDGTIKKDFDAASVAVVTKEKELRAERLKLIKDKIRGRQGSGVDLTVDNGECEF